MDTLTQRQTEIAEVYWLTPLTTERVVELFDIKYDDTDGLTELWEAVDTYHDLNPWLTED